MGRRPEDVPAGSLLLRLSSRLPAGTTPLRLSLEPLDVAGTAGLVSSMLDGEHVSERFAAFLHGRTDGVPLALEESVRLMHDRAELTRRDGAARSYPLVAAISRHNPIWSWGPAVVGESRRTRREGSRYVS